jgi:hypothetical protein
VEALVYDRHMTRWDVVIVTLTAHASTTHTCICMYAQAKNWTGLLTMMHAECRLLRYFDTLYRTTTRPYRDDWEWLIRHKHMTGHPSVINRGGRC